MKNKIDFLLPAKPKSFDVKVKVIKFNILGTETHYTCDEWIDDDNHPEGGSYQKVKKMYENTMVEIDFLAEVDIEVQPRNIYSDGKNKFVAISKHKIKNANEYIKEFEIPTKLACISDMATLYNIAKLSFSDYDEAKMRAEKRKDSEQ